MLINTFSMRKAKGKLINSFSMRKCIFCCHIFSWCFINSVEGTKMTQTAFTPCL